VSAIPLETSRSGRPGRRSRKHRYEDVIELIQGRIASERLGPGSRLPTNAELAHEAGVSLITVRRALDELEHDGDIVRYQGVGTFVARGRILSEPTKSGELAQTLGVDRQAVTTRLVDLYRGRPSPVIAGTLGLGPDELAWSVVRIRLVDDRPRILEQATLPARLVPSPDRAVLEAGGSLYSMLAQRYGLFDDHEEQYLALARPSPDERAALRLGRGHQVIRIRGVTFTADGTPFDAFEQVYPADAFVFFFSGQTSRQLLSGSHHEDWRVTPAR
jgi:DNA-binding GntR family transcriptional regulator